MKKIILFLFIPLLFLFSSCPKEPKEHIAPVNQLVKDLFCFQTGSEWTYYDSISQTTQKMMITNNITTRFASMPGKGQKVYEFAEVIKISGYFLTDFEIKASAQEEGKEYDNTAIFRGTYTSPHNTRLTIPLRFRCDANNVFDCSVEYFAEYNVSGINYSNVYVFDMDDSPYNTENIVFYVAKNIGIIRLIRLNDFDWVLIDKNVKQ